MNYQTEAALRTIAIFVSGMMFALWLFESGKLAVQKRLPIEKEKAMGSDSIPFSAARRRAGQS